MAAEYQRERGGRIKALRLAIRPRLTQSKLAQELGVSYRTVQLWEAGENLEIDNLEKLAQYFGVTEGYILNGDDGDGGDDEGEADGHNGPPAIRVDVVVARLVAIEAGQRAIVSTIVEQQQKILDALEQRILAAFAGFDQAGKDATQMEPTAEPGEGSQATS